MARIWLVDPARGPLPQDKGVEIARDLCGLAAAHEQGLLHRDLKPANILLDGRGRVRIADFGLASIAGEVRDGEIRAGTPAYMAPEQLAGREVTIKSDIYALGLVLYEIFTGKRAYDAPSAAESIRLRESSAPISPISVVKELDPLIERVILRCLERILPGGPLRLCKWLRHYRVEILWRRPWRREKHLPPRWSRRQEARKACALPTSGRAWQLWL